MQEADNDPTGEAVQASQMVRFLHNSRVSLLSFLISALSNA